MGSCTLRNAVPDFTYQAVHALYAVKIICNRIVTQCVSNNWVPSPNIFSQISISMLKIQNFC